MFNVSKITTKLLGAVGFRQPFNTSYAIIDADNLASKSGLYVTDNEFCKVESIYDSQDYAGISNSDFNTYLKTKQKESITNVCSLVFNESDFIDRGLFYKYAQNKIAAETLPTGFVGYRIQVEEDKNIAINFKRVLLDFQGTGTFNLLLFNTAQSAPLQTKTITITTDHQAVDLDWIVDNSDGTYKGEFYIGYLTTGLTVAPYKRDYERSNLLSLFTHLCIEPSVVTGHTTATLFDLTQVQSTSQATGLNFDITVFEDYTDLIISNEFLFSRAILLDLQISCLTTVIASIRSNANERTSSLNIGRLMAEVQGQTGEGVIKIVGLKPQLYRSIENIRTEIEKLRTGYFGKGIFTDTLN